MFFVSLEQVVWNIAFFMGNFYLSFPFLHLHLRLYSCNVFFTQFFPPHSPHDNCLCFPYDKQ